MDLAEKHLLHLSQISSQLDPNLTSFYLHQFRLRCEYKKVKIPLSLSSKYCRYCSSLFIPGNNCTIRIKRRKNKNKDKNKHQSKKKSQEKNKKRNKKESKNKNKSQDQNKKTNKKELKKASNNATNEIVSDFQNQDKSKPQNYIVYTCHCCQKQTKFKGKPTNKIKQLKQGNQQQVIQNKHIQNNSKSSNRNRRKRKKKTSIKKMVIEQQNLKKQEKKTDLMDFFKL
ncbi:ribonuclease p subunit p21 [Anaeramoeba flamelloides]|uniref:Ribonuclease p subunit p21 n=1 Tax=Anaeramoeba flamelloides TaxID=1746091 RepID=A0AAV8AF72_9EUKA|nr:ribonuclease p subunit p21 [Anaeramoeba flamelloides]